MRGKLFNRIVARGHYIERGAAHDMKTIVKVVQVKFVVFLYRSDILNGIHLRMCVFFN